MAKTKISELDAAAANNTDINSVDVSEGCAPSGINNAIREMGAMLKRMDNGTDHLTNPNITGDLDVDNININGNTISSTNTNGNVTVDPNGSGQINLSANVDVTGTVTADGLTMDTSADSAYSAIFGANRTGAGTALGLIKGSWNGNTVAQINLLAGSDTTNKDDGRIQLRTSNSGGSVLNRFQIDENGDISFYADNGTTQALFFDASTQRLGLGTTSPSTNLEINGGANNNIVRIVSTDANANIEFADNTTTSGLSIGANGDNMKFGINGTEAMRISAGSTIFKAPDGGSRYLFGGTGNSDNAELSLYDSSDAQKVRIGAGVDSFFNGGNVLVGTTDNSPGNNSGSGNDGIALKENGSLQVARTDADAAQFNRLNSDGDIALFRKNGTTVASIGTFAGDFIVGSTSGSDAAFRMDGTNNAIYASNTSGNARDAAINLGASTVRWKDLYLSGGVYLGGTGSSNHLDDYEEGTWTPVAAGGGSNPTNLSHAIQSGNYVKIGGMVYVSFRCRFSFDSGTGSGTININGLPFTAANHTQPKSAPQHDNISFSGFEYLEMSAGANSTSVVFAKNRSAAGANSLLLSDCNASSTDVNGGFMYFV